MNTMYFFVLNLILDDDMKNFKETKASSFLFKLKLCP